MIKKKILSLFHWLLTPPVSTDERIKFRKVRLFTLLLFTFIILSFFYILLRLLIGKNILDVRYLLAGIFAVSAIILLVLGSMRRISLAKYQNRSELKEKEEQYKTLANDIPGNHTAVNSINSIQTTAEKTASLTERLLVFGPKQSTEPRIVNINEQLVSLENMLHGLENTAAAPAKKPVPVKAEDLMNEQKETLLVVEDEPDLRDVIINILQGNGYQTHDAGTGEEALELCSRLKGGKIDMLITDVVMPGMNGKELADEMVKLFSEIKILFISGYTGKRIVTHDILSRGLSFLAKPFSPTELLQKIRLILDSKN